MRIAFDAKRIFNNQTGLGNYSRSLVNQLVKGYPQNDYFLYTPKIKLYGQFLQDSPKVNQVLPSSPISKLLPGVWRNQLLVEDLVQKKIDIYHGLSNELPLGIEHTSIKTLVAIHDLIFLKYPENYPWLDRQFYKQKFKSAVNRADKVIATSVQTKNDIIFYYGTEASKIEVIYQNCDEIFNQNYPDSQKVQIRNKYQLPQNYILSVGTLEKRKNHLSLLKALKKISNPKLQLILVGKKGDAFPQIREFIDQSGLAQQVTILDEIDFLDLPLIYQMADLFVYPSFYEGFGIPVLEALRSRVPVLTSNISSLPEVAGDACMLVDPSDIDAMAQAITNGLEDTHLRGKLLDNSIEQIKQFDSGLLSNQLMDIYKSLLQSE